MFNSIRWNLLIWQAVILLLVVAGSGAWLYAWFRRTTLAEVDSQLLGMAQVISAACSAADGSPQSPRLPREYLERFGRKPDEWPYFVVWDAGGDVLAASPAPDTVPPPQRREASQKRPAAKHPADKPPGAPPPGGDGTKLPDERHSQPRATKALTAPVAQRGQQDDEPRAAKSPATLLQQQDEDHPTKLPRTSADELANPPPKAKDASSGKLPGDATSAGRPAVLKPAGWPSQAKTAWPPRVGPPPWYPRDRIGVREVILEGPAGFQVLVGKTIHKEERRLAALLQQVLLSGGGVLLLGLTGCWFLARRALRPIDQISLTAESISASNLSRRIDLADTTSELGRLAVVLNHTFDRLEAAFQRQVRFTADASHELRTPLAVIAAQVELALARPRTPEQYRQALQACQRAAQRMKPLVEDLLCLSRGDAGRLALRREPFDLAACVQGCVEFFQPLAQQQQVAFVLRLQPCTVRGDADSTARAVGNVIDNALRYNRPGGSVEIRLSHQPAPPAEPADAQQPSSCDVAAAPGVGRAAACAGPGPSPPDTSADVPPQPAGGWVVLTIADTGVGIPPEDVDRVFDRFFRVEAARSRHDAGGSGLGLAICKELVEAQGGTVALHSQLGVGTTVEIRLPLAAEGAEADPAGHDGALGTEASDAPRTEAAC